jgi:hypothetical protein
MTSTSRITYAHRPGVTPETELSVLANVYRFVLKSHATTRVRIPDKCDPESEGPDEVERQSKTQGR